MILTRVAVRRRIATAVIAVALTVLGAWGFTRLPVDFLPSITYPMIKVHIWWRGATTEDVARDLAEPIEQQMATVDGLDWLESSSIEGMYTLQANFGYGVDVDVAYQDALAALARVARELPPDIDPPVIIKADPSQLPILQITAGGEGWDAVRLRTWADNWLKDRLVAVPGVAGVEVVGGLEREIRVLLDPEAVASHGLTLVQVQARLSAANMQVVGGRVTAGPHELIARTTGEFTDLEQIRATVLLSDGAGRVVRVRDLATVADGHAETRIVTRIDSKPCVKLSVLKQAAANTVAVARAVEARLGELAPALPAGVQLGVVENQAAYVQAAVDGVRDAALLALGLVLGCVWLFLGSWRQVLVLAIALPVTLILNFALMALGGFSFNIFSLGGLVVAVGVVLDNSIVALENISRLHRQKPDEPLVEVAERGTAEVGSAIVAATVGFLALFLPFLFVPGLASLLLREQILVIGGVVLLSLLCAVTLTPMLAGSLLAHEVQETSFQRVVAWITERYRRSVATSLRRPGLVVIIAGVIAAAGFGLAPRLGSEFLPRMDDGRVMVKVRLPTGAALAETDAAISRVEAALADDPLIDSAFTLVGGKVWGLYTYEIANEGEVNIQLVAKPQRKIATDVWLAALRKRLSAIQVPGGQVMVMPMPVKGIRKVGDADVEVKLGGDDLPTLFRLAGEAATAMRGTPDLANVNLSLDLAKPEYRIEVDRDRAAAVGLTVGEVGAAMRTLVNGSVITRYRDGADLYDLRVLVPPERLASSQDLERLPIDLPGGGTARLGEVARIVRSSGPVQIDRIDQVPQVIIRADTAAGVDIGRATQAAQAALTGLDLPPGYTRIFGGQSQQAAETRQVMLAIVAFALFFAFVALAVQFNSLVLPVVILVSVPFAAAGVVAGLVIAGAPIGATVVIGFLVVVATVLNDGVLLLEFAEHLRGQGQDPTSAVTDAAAIRLRPRLMVAVPMLLGLAPLALGLHPGSEMLKPLAAAAVGGIAAALPVALWLMPALYRLVVRDRPVTQEHA